MRHDGTPPRTLARLFEGLRRRAGSLSRLRSKYAGEASWWRDERARVERWFAGEAEWCGIRPPSEAEKVRQSPLLLTNAVLTVHRMAPHYPRILGIDADRFAGRRILEVGCGPLAPVMQFAGCERHGLDPLVDSYLRSGWPLYDYPVSFVAARGEEMPYADGYFDAVISVNALDHVDDFARVASEIQRVLGAGGELFLEIDCHPPRRLEPQALDDAKVRAAFGACRMRKVCQRTAREKDALVAEAFGISAASPEAEGDSVLAVWHGSRP